MSNQNAETVLKKGEEFSFAEVVHGRLKWFYWDSVYLPGEYPDFKE